MKTLVSSKIFLGVVVSIITLVGLWGVWKNLEKGGNQQQTETVELNIEASDWQKGSASASATLVEYSDFQCPACKIYAPLVNTFVNKNGASVRSVYRHYPLPQHKNAKLAAYYADAAGLQGKFFEMHDKLFVEQDKWSEVDNPDDIFQGYAKDLKLDMDKLKLDVTSSGVKQNIESDIQSGNAAGINATPTFYLNGKKITAPQSLEEFEKLLKDNGS